jgi:hypothetical protein
MPGLGWETVMMVLMLMHCQWLEMLLSHMVMRKERVSVRR